MYEKEHVFKYKIKFLDIKWKGRQPVVPFPPNHQPFIGNPTQSKQIFLVWSKFFNYIVGGGSYYGVPKKWKFNLGGWVKYAFLAITYFFGSYITEEEINDLKQLYLYYLVVLLREVTIHI